MSKKAYFKLYKSNIGLSTMITENTVKILEMLLEEAKAALAAAPKPPEGKKPSGGYIRMYPISEDKCAEWGLPEGSQNLVVMSQKEIAESKRRNEVGF